MQIRGLLHITEKRFIVSLRLFLCVRWRRRMVVMGTFFRFFESKNRYKWIKKPARRMRHQVKSVTYVKLEATDEQVDPTERQAVKAVVPETPPVQEIGRASCRERV